MPCAATPDRSRLFLLWTTACPILSLPDEGLDRCAKPNVRDQSADQGPLWGRLNVDLAGHSFRMVLDMTAHWTPAVQTFLGRVTKAHFLAAVPVR